MSEAVLTGGLRLNSLADKVLKRAAVFWFLVAVVGQWVFAYYVVALYGGSAMRGDLAAWNSAVPHGIVPGDALGNFAFAAHVLMAFIVTVGGPLQLISQIRSRAPTFHRWNGRIYILTAFAISIDGLYMVLTRGTVGGVWAHVSISLNAVLIMIFAAIALRYAMARDIATHRRWALRLFMVVSGVWFFRVGLMFWILINNGPVGFDPKTFQGPAIVFVGFAQYLVPLAVLELYIRTQDRAGAPGQFAMAAGLLVLTIAMGVGIFGAYMGMWLPRL